jgi:hypothetical protein
MAGVQAGVRIRHAHETPVPAEGCAEGAGHIWRGRVVIHVRCAEARGTIGGYASPTMSEDNEHDL